jgi:CheY-like chemotaxis protein
LARKILLADDSVTAQNMGRKILADAGYEVITVNNGSAALKKIAEQKPDLIVLDVYMPGYSGLEVCQRLKEAQETSRVPVLLTVGKLEPFKPEEAKRVRADGFIVKPFEASELLSALSKLEDKIVPRAESSKPGRFARATAALDEGRYDKTVAIEEDSGWKNRIGFPSKKKKETPAQDDADESAIYNAMNNDLRTKVERKMTEEGTAQRKTGEPQTEQPRPVKTAEARVDLGALAPEGLPKDVTPEEIAALAAAAAQVKGKIADPVEAGVEQNKIEQSKIEPEAPVAESTPLATELPREVPEAQPAVAALAEQKSQEKIEETIAVPSVPAPSPADVIAAIAGLEVDNVATPAATSGHGSWSHSKADLNADEPVTMAVAAGAESHPAASRWTAVSVALAPEEAAISLELEMQKAYAAFAAAEPAATTSVSSGIESAVTQLPAPELPAPVPATPAPEAAQVLTEMASAATDAITNAVKELEAAAASYLEHKTPASTQSAPVPETKAESDKFQAHRPEASRTIEASVGENPATNRLDSEPEAEKLETAKEDTAETKQDPNAASAPTSESTAPASAELRQASQTSDAAAPTPGEPAAGRTEYPVRKESEIAADTAAAWASWRRNREPGAPEPATAESFHPGEEMARDPQDAAAMAVAAGAEKTPEESSPTSQAAPESDQEGIASIVDSVLAEMRPKIYEEISRKMKKK